MPRYAYSYMRFSSGRQFGNDSIRRQTESTRVYCQRKGMILVETVFADMGVSGFDGSNVSDKNPAKKPALRRFMEMCESGAIPRGSALVVEALDRISRQDPWKAIGLLIEIRRLGIELHVTMTGTIIPAGDAATDEDGDHEADRALQEAVWGVIAAHRESSKKSKRLKAVFAAKRAAAGAGKGIVSKSLPWWLEFKGGKIAPIPERTAVLKEIFTLTAKGKSSQTIARLFNGRKVPTWRPKAKEWEDSRIRQIIISEAAQGTLTPTPKTVAAGGDAATYRIEKYYPRIISDLLALKARARMKENTVTDRNVTPKGGRPVNLFKGILRHNGRWCRHQSHRNGKADDDGVKSWNSYYDDHDPNHAGKKTWSISGAQLEEVILLGIRELNANDLAAPIGKIVHRSIKLRQALRDLDLQIEHIVVAIKQGKGSRALTGTLAELEDAQERAKIRLQEAELEEARPRLQSTDADLKTLSLDLNDPETRSRVALAIQRLIRRIHVADDGLEIPDFVQFDASMGGAGLHTVAYFAKDSLPRRSKRRRSIFALVAFRDGGYRAIHRPSIASTIVSGLYVKKTIKPPMPEHIAKQIDELRRRRNTPPTRVSR